MRKHFIILTVISATLFGAGTANAQNDKVKFGGYARAWQENNTLAESDTVNADRESQGHTLIDLGININPDANTQVQALVRFKTDLGGFFGASASAELRQLYVKGNIAKIIGYEVGDIYLEMSPFTLYNNDAEGNINEGTLFTDLRNDIVHYDNFNRGNRWWQQGAHADFGLEFDDMFVQKMFFDAFFLRNMGNRFHSGGRILIEQSDNLNIKANYLNLFDVASTFASTETVLSNPVTSFELDYTRGLGGLDFLFDAESGFSNLKHSMDDSVLSENSGIFFDIASGVKKGKLTVKAGYRYVDPRFYSSGAQSKRVDFTAAPTVFANSPNSLSSLRAINTFDLMRTQRVYNQTITPILMNYDMRLSNAMPFGVATPNRAGVYVDAGLKDSLKKYDTFLKLATLSEATPTNSTVKKNYLVAQLGGDINFHNILSWNKDFTINIGAQYESTKRSDGASSVDLTSTIIDFGLEAEVFEKLKLLGGTKVLLSSGNELVSTRDAYNEITTAVPTNVSIDEAEVIFAYGLRYTLSKQSYILLQHQLFFYDNYLNPSTDYDFNQFSILFKMAM